LGVILIEILIGGNPWEMLLGNEYSIEKVKEYLSESKIFKRPDVLD
jgi:hypothetical protein